ncbi:DNA repair protein RecO [Neiella marina]|uniref:DNA repair protein RecO n=1 Tax=Neiella holothuriorum TaxID=2870530 RepID=A0ABS7EB75_9GAMM|nr:DNA repair protein RecO [Neiella holothuriorum]MBW8189580.1 DNA repair protein RecO [Neiella holothuriorum]
MARTRAQLEPAYLLSRRPYREDSALIDVLTQHHGLLRLVARGLRRKRQPLAAILQPFTPLLLSWQAKSELGQLQAAETASASFQLQGDQTLAGFYLNELVSRLLEPMEAAEPVFAYYAQAIDCLADPQQRLEPTLRRFEHELLNHLGYGLNDLAQIDPDAYYQWDPQQGLLQTEYPSSILGWHLQHIEQADYQLPEVAKAAKILIRQRLEPLLAGRPLKSRQVWLQMKRGKV